MCPLEFERNMVHKIKRDLNIKKNEDGFYVAEPVGIKLKNDGKHDRDRLNKLRIKTFDNHLFNASQTNMGMLTPDVVQKYAIENFASEVIRHSFLDYAGPRLGYLARVGLLNDVGTSTRVYHERVVVKGVGLDRRLSREYKQDYRYVINTSLLEYIKSFRLQKDLKAKENLKTEIEHFKISNVHKFMFKFCKGGEFSLKSYREYISWKLNGESLEREMGWKKSSCEKLARVGLFEKISEDAYKITGKFIAAMNYTNEDRKNRSLAKNNKEIKQSIPGQNHIRLLRFAKNGVLNFKDVETHIKSLPVTKQARETVMKRGMVKNLIEAGYLEGINNSDSITSDGNDKPEFSFKPGLFKLTARALELIESSREKVKIDKSNDIPVDNQNTLQKAEKELKITRFDIDNIIKLSMGGLLSKKTISLSAKKAAVEKRILTLLDSGLLIQKTDGWQLTDELLDRAKVRENINLEHQLSHSKKRSLDCLTAEQRKTIEDIKDFFNLSGSQILKFIYKGNEKLYKSDMEYLLKKGILEKDLIRDVYILSKTGTKLAAEITGDNNIFGSKIHSRREELRHDLLIYSAFKDMEAELKAKGKVITAFKTERKLRSEDMKTLGRMREEYPDLYIEFEDEKTKEKGSVNIEVDVGYSNKVIAQKLRIPNLRWYTNRQAQKEKVLKKARYIGVKVIEEEYWKAHYIKR